MLDEDKNEEFIIGFRGKRWEGMDHFGYKILAQPDVLLMTVRIVPPSDPNFAYLSPTLLSLFFTFFIFFFLKKNKKSGW